MDSHCVLVLVSVPRISFLSKCNRCSRNGVRTRRIVFLSMGDIPLSSPFICDLKRYLLIVPSSVIFGPDSFWVSGSEV